MSTSLIEVIESAGFDIENNIEDARWFLAQKSQFDEKIEQIEEVIDDLEAQELEDCEHDDTYIEDVEDTAEYEQGQAIGSNPILHQSQIEICENCGKQRNLPEGEWENV